MCRLNVCVGLPVTQNLLEKYKRCVQLHGDYESASDAVRQWIMSAHQQFDAAELLSQSREDLLRKQKLLKVDDTPLLFVDLFGQLVLLDRQCSEFCRIVASYSTIK